MSHINVFLAILTLCSIYAWLRGGAPERIGASIMMTGFLATLFAAPQSANFQQVLFGVLLIDAVMFASFVLLALRAERYWPMWMAALIGFGLFGHGLKGLMPGTLPIIYMIAHVFSGYPTIALLAIATHRHQKRLRRSGTDRSWST